MPLDEREFDISTTSIPPPSVDSLSSPRSSLDESPEYNRHHTVDLLQRSDSLRRRSRFVSHIFELRVRDSSCSRNRRESVDDAAIKAAVFSAAEQIYEEQEESQDALLLQVGVARTCHGHHLNQVSLAICV